MTVEGSHVHERCDNADIREKRGDVLVVRALPVTSRRLGLSGVCDVVEFRQGKAGARLYGEPGLWNPVPVEYKRGTGKLGDEDRVQVCAQAMALEEIFFIQIERGFLFYDSEKGREAVAFSAELRAETEGIARRMHADFVRGYTPPPKMRKGCRSCSFRELCAPKLERSGSVDSYITRMLGGE